MENCALPKYHPYILPLRIYLCPKRGEDWAFLSWTHEIVKPWIHLQLHFSWSLWESFGSIYFNSTAISCIFFIQLNTENFHWILNLWINRCGKILNLCGMFRFHFIPIFFHFSLRNFLIIIHPTEKNFITFCVYFFFLNVFTFIIY